MSKKTDETVKILNAWLDILIKYKGTDLHVKSNAPIRARLKGAIKRITDDNVSDDNMKNLLLLLMNDKANISNLDEIDFDGTYMHSKAYRFRVHIYKHYSGYSINFRLIPQDIKTIEELNLPTSLHKLAKLERGLVLITGTTGSGKSTLLASIIEEINRHTHKHIITIEDPIEYIYNDKHCIIEQREIGSHTPSFSNALRASMREDPDVIVVGEIRDLATAESILQAASTGHLVFSTVHTLDAKETIERMISIFPTEEQNRVRTTLAATLEAVVSQRLVKGINNQMLPAVELMYKSPLIQELIRQKRDDEIIDVLAKEGHSFGTQTFNQSLYHLIVSGKISEKIGFQYATSPSDLKLMLSLSEEYKKH